MRAPGMVQTPAARSTSRVTRVGDSSVPLDGWDQSPTMLTPKENLNAAIRSAGPCRVDWQAPCEKYGQRVQLSVFECRLSPARLARLIGEIEDIIDCQRDSVIDNME